MTFSQPSYLSIDDPYEKRMAVSSRFLGSQFKTNPPKKGTTPDVLFDPKHKALSENDKYLDPGAADKKGRTERDKLKLTPEGFKYSSPPKRATGLGAYYGCFNERKPFAHEAEYQVIKRGDIPSRPKAQPKNIITSAPHKGTYGCVGTTLSKGEEYKYTPDPFDGHVKATQQESKESSKKMLAGSWKPVVRSTFTFDSHPNVAASKVYTIEKALPPIKKEPPPKPFIAAQPFKPSSPPKRGVQGTIGKMPEHKDDVYGRHEKVSREEAAKAKAMAVWKPVSARGEMATKSVMYNDVKFIH